MELSAWRSEVPYGAYIPPIHLHVARSASQHTDASTDQVSRSKSPQKTQQTSPKADEDTAKPTNEADAPVATSNDDTSLANSEKPIGESSEAVILPPFASECLNQGQQMALNVGGPVWAMDWLPLPSVISSAAPTATTKTKTKKPKKTISARRTKGKENNKVEQDQETTTTAGEDTTGSLPLEWRFLALSTHPPCQVTDGKVVKAMPPDHYYDAPEGARNLVQIWAVPVPSKKKATTGRQKGGKNRKTVKPPLVKPRMVYAIDHESGVAWDLQWCPMAEKLPKKNDRKELLGVLAVCFGDGSLRIFDVPAIPEERLQTQPSKDSTCIVEKKIPVAIASLPRILQLSVQWSPFHWNKLLTGGSDGSVSMWNIEAEMTRRRRQKSERTEPVPIEPQRRFQDADTIGKQEAFDWGCGWVAIRAVAWSPFDEYLFATTGNDSVFKVWDIREPRSCLRSHRIRSTWGLSLQWMDETSIQISGDQGSIYMYDILSGSYQKLHFHPQIDSPVWDLQFGRRGDAPLLVSSCASGSIRAAPAKKLYRAPQKCVEICRLTGSKDPSEGQPFKSLTVSFDTNTILGSADTVSTATREFCERDAALHRLRVTSTTAGVYPCYLAAAGHAGLVLLLELQEVMDTLLSTHFRPPSKKIGRPKKIFGAVGAHRALKKTPSKNGDAVRSGRKARTLGSFAKAKGMHTALSKYKKKSLGGMAIAKGKAKRAKSKKKAFIQEDGDVDMADDCDDSEEEEPEYDEDEDGASESDLSLVMDDNSDDDLVSASDHEEEETGAPEANAEESRLMTEYQLDLSEEDALLLAIQMSRADTAAPASAVEATTDAGSSPLPLTQEPRKRIGDTRQKTKPSRAVKTKTTTKSKEKAVPKTQAKAKREGKTTKGKKRALPSKTAIEEVAEHGVTEDIEADPAITENADKSEHTRAVSSTTPARQTKQAASGSTTTASIARRGKKKAAVIVEAGNTKQTVSGAVGATATSPTTTKRGKKHPTKVPPARRTTNRRESSVLEQTMALQMFNFQMGLSEEDAMKEALRLSEMEEKHPVAVDQTDKVPPRRARRQSVKTPSKSPNKPTSKAKASSEEKAPIPTSATATTTTTSELPPTKSEAKKPAKRPRSSESKVPTSALTASKRKKTTAAPVPRRGRHSTGNAGNDDALTEDDVLMMALKMSEIEY
ncbi:hypothetical protein PHYBOEH_002835 [Phytophthora boehmeriae]|uniref:WD40 repeat-like protein n=1 Tax=Phytophthora boehmeriae TaxID=109152 RepID=A0A8T1WTS1_9STRA|nr:hypothetical protein PHYBOEH_002835 [Phytophthora boehmeriae]